VDITQKSRAEKLPYLSAQAKVFYAARVTIDKFKIFRQLLGGAQKFYRA
jgi:hypothetical protein